MDREINNPVSAILKAFREIDYADAMQKELGQPVSKYDLTETMLVLANSQMALLDLVTSMKRNDEDVQKHADYFSAQIGNIIEAALAAGGEDFADKVIANLRADHE